MDDLIINHQFNDRTIDHIEIEEYELYQIPVIYFKDGTSLRIDFSIQTRCEYQLKMHLKEEESEE